MTPLLLAVMLLGQSDSVEFRIIPNASKIHVYDCLIIKAVVANHGEKPARAPKPISVEFEKRVADRAIRIEPNDPRAIGCPLPVPSSDLQPGHVSVSYWDLVGDGTATGFHFAQAGKYEIRGRIKGTDRELVSSSIIIEVVDRPIKEVELIIKHAETMYSYLGYRDLSNENAVEKHKPLLALESGSTRQTVDRVLRTAEYLRTGRVGDQSLPPHKAVASLVEGMNEVERDFAVFHLCAHCENQKDWPELARLRPHLLEDSTIRQQIDVRLRHYGLMKPLPRERKP